MSGNAASESRPKEKDHALRFHSRASILLASLTVATSVVAPACARAQALTAGTPVRTLARGSTLVVRQGKELTSKEAKPGDLITATVAHTVIDKDVRAIPEGTTVTLRVVDVVRSSLLHNQNGHLTLEAVSLALPTASASVAVVPLLSNTVSVAGEMRQSASVPAALSSVLWRTSVNRYYNPTYGSTSYVEARIAGGALLNFSMAAPIAIPR